MKTIARSSTILMALACFCHLALGQYGNSYRGAYQGAYSSSPASGAFHLIDGSFKDINRAYEAAHNLELLGYNSVQVLDRDNSGYYRVSLFSNPDKRQVMDFKNDVAVRGKNRVWIKYMSNARPVQQSLGSLSRGIDANSRIPLNNESWNGAYAPMPPTDVLNTNDGLIPPISSTTYMVIAGSFRGYPQANSHRDFLVRSGYSKARVIMPDNVNQHYRVSVYESTDIGAAENYTQLARRDGLNAWVKSYEDLSGSSTGGSLDPLPPLPTQTRGNDIPTAFPEARLATQFYVIASSFTDRYLAEQALRGMYGYPYADIVSGTDKMGNPVYRVAVLATTNRQDAYYERDRLKNDGFKGAWIDIVQR